MRLLCLVPTGDSSAASTFSASAKEIEASINKHWDAASGVIQETLPPHPGPQKFQELDCAVVLGALEGDMGDGYFGANDQRVLSSAAKLRTAFNGVYAINDLDSQRGLGGFLIGRYPNDTYDGYETSGKGNPWFLCTQVHVCAPTECHRRFTLAALFHRRSASSTTGRRRRFWSRRKRC